LRRRRPDQRARVRPRPQRGRVRRRRHGARALRQVRVQRRGPAGRVVRPRPGRVPALVRLLLDGAELMLRRVLLAGVLALVAWAILIGFGAVIVTAGTGTLDGRATGWVAVNLVAALVAGFAASRACVDAPVWARYAAASTGPVLLSLEFTLTTH